MSNAREDLLAALSSAFDAGELAIEKFGLPSRIEKTLEELSELAVSLHHYRLGKVSTAAVVDEVADVLLMALQLAQLFGPGASAQMLRYKAVRLVDKANGRFGEVV